MAGLRKVQVVVALASIVVLLSGCTSIANVVVVKKPPARVSVKAYPLDLVYGAELTPQEALQQTELALESADLGFSDEFQFEELSFGPGSPIAAPDPCPAPSGDTVVEPISLDVTRAMAPGTYRWQQEGSFEIVGLIKVPIAGPTLRTIRSVTPEANGAFTYEIQSIVSIRVQIQRFRVIPNDGVYLLYSKTTAGSSTKEFQPVLPVEIFPLPASAGAAVGPSVGIDVGTREVLQVTGQVSRKERYEGCGEAYDAWLAETTWTFQRPGEAQVPWDLDYALAPQLGGLFVFDHLAATEVFSTNPPLTIKTDMNSTLAAITPTPESGY